VHGAAPLLFLLDTHIPGKVYLSPAQASEGGTFRVQVAARVVCPTCYGEGWVGPYRCRQCDATGTTVVECPLTVSYPAGIASGDVGRVSLGGVGLPGSDLVVHFRARPREINPRYTFRWMPGTALYCYTVPKS